MSKKSTIRNKIYQEYFKEMKETSREVDSEIIKVINYIKGRKENKVSKGIEFVISRLYEGVRKGELGRRIGNPKQRSYFTKLVYEICDGQKTRDFIPIAAAMDVVDTSFYASDAVLDKELKDLKIIHEKLIYSHVIEYLASELIVRGLKKLNLSRKDNDRILDIWRELLIDTYEGFYIETQGIPDRRIYYRRTRAYSAFRQMFKIASIAALAKDKQQQDAFVLGDLLGQAYMTINDALDIAKNFEDIKTGKWTLPNLLYYEKCDKQQKSQFDRVFGNPNIENDELILIGTNMIKYKVIRDCVDHALDLAERYVQILERFPKKYTRQKSMLKFALFILMHNKLYEKLEERYSFKREKEFRSQRRRLENLIFKEKI